MNAFSRPASASMRRRHCSVISADVIPPLRSLAPNASTVSVSNGGAIGPVVEVGGAQRPQRLREYFEQRFQVRQVATLSVGDRPFDSGYLLR